VTFARRVTSSAIEKVFTEMPDLVIPDINAPDGRLSGLPFLKHDKRLGR
jgi:hypothetical protein